METVFSVASFHTHCSLPALLLWRFLVIGITSATLCPLPSRGRGACLVGLYSIALLQPARDSLFTVEG